MVKYLQDRFQTSQKTNKPCLYPAVHKTMAICTSEAQDVFLPGGDGLLPALFVGRSHRRFLALATWDSGVKKVKQGVKLLKKCVSSFRIAELRFLDVFAAVGDGIGHAGAEDLGCQMDLHFLFSPFYMSCLQLVCQPLTFLLSRLVEDADVTPTDVLLVTISAHNPA